MWIFVFPFQRRTVPPVRLELILTFVDGNLDALVEIKEVIDNVGHFPLVSPFGSSLLHFVFQL